MRRFIAALLLCLVASSARADSTVAALTAASTLTGAELFYCTQGGADRKCTINQVSTFMAGTFLTQANNLSDVSSATTARSNLAAAGTGVTNTFSQPQTFASGTITSSAAGVNITQTWNNSGTTFDAPLFMNVTNSASAAASRIMDLQVGGSSVNSVDVSGNIYGTSSSIFISLNPSDNIKFTNFSDTMSLSDAGLRVIAASNSLQLGNAANYGVLSAEAATANPTLAVRDGTRAATFRVYNTTDGNAAPTNYERGVLDWTISANTFTIATQAGGTGSNRGITIAPATAVTTITGSLTVSALANAATTSAVCYNTGTGVITYDGTIGTCTVSAARYKAGFRDISDGQALAMVDAMKPKSWHYLWEPDRDRIGLVADDLLAIDPRLVGFDADGRVENDNYWAVITLLVGATKELRAEIEELKRRVR